MYILLYLLDCVKNNFVKIFFYTGKSGVQVGISESSDPVMTDFGDLYANFEYHGNGGKMEVSIGFNWKFRSFKNEESADLLNDW